MTSFYVYLPSNVKDIFNTNTISNYITNLPAVLRLDENWEVGLAEILYKKSWYNITTTQKIRILTESGHVLHDKESDLQPGSYRSADELITIINAKLGILLHKLGSSVDSMHGYSPELEYNSLDGRVSVTNGKIGNTTKALLIPIFDDDLADLLGIGEKYYAEYYGYGNSQGNVVIVTTEGIKAMRNTLRDIDINAGINGLYVYCNIIKPSFVGDTFSKLLRVVQVPNISFGETTQKIYDRPHYFQLSSNEINTIEIDIKDDTGENIKFNSGRVVVVLHFRKHELD